MRSREFHKADYYGPSPAARPVLKRSLGLWMATALVIGNMIGSGVFLLPSSLAAEAGPVSIFALILTGVGAMMLALVFANLGRAFPRTGGPYAYSRRAFGDFVGFQTAWGYWIAVWAGNAAIAVAFVSYASVFWGSLATNHLLAAGVGIGTIWLLTWVNILGVREGGITQLVTAVLKFVPLLAIGVIGIFFVKADNFTPLSPNGSIWAGMSTAAALTLWAFIGLESATVPAEEVKDPERNIPRATIYGTLGTTILYLLAIVAVMGIVPIGRLAVSNSPFALAASEMFGGAWGKVVAAIAMISAFGCLNGWILLQGRVPLAAARDGLFPKAFGRVDEKRHTPVFGLVVSSLLVSGLMMMNYTEGLVSQFTFFLLLATLTTLVPYAYSAAAEIHMFFSDRELFSGRKLGRDVAVASLAFAYSVWAIYGAGFEVIAKGFMLMMFGIPVYLYLKWREQKRPSRPVAPPMEELRIDVPEAWIREKAPIG
jgi:basic amino acid/polyamine antiporter, APA family